MYRFPRMYPCPYHMQNQMYQAGQMSQCPYCTNMPMHNPSQLMMTQHQCLPCPDQSPAGTPIRLMDYGPNPFAVNIEEATTQNDNYRLALWTGEHLQLTLMSIDVGGDIGLEIHPHVDQFIRIEEGQGLVQMGDRRDQLDFQANVCADFIFIIPAGKWHNLTNTGNTPIKLYSIYAPPNHPHGTIHQTKEDAEEQHD
ncbi:cupin domain-containing protein [Dehalobacterium formicoaceticum]|uniref:Cupin domain-containing protein n=1 Tax=Dehalobacterium formicoaceticum TaxID=51515 RepID=A0ABT1Y7X7_9FIRM|nr:cupin domain-containing protein [Dehalobacterium formicoaceticum]MCR6546668.1 cupin domain-containing protein [Dehalobacterium formicoaceticum]